jgi:hypothetical protein
MSTLGFEAQQEPGLFTKVSRQAAAAGREARRRQLFPLKYAIPDDPNHQRYTTISYRIDATELAKDVSEDLKKGEHAHFVLELADWGIVGLEIFAESAATAFLAIGSPLLAMVGNFLALGMPYMEINKELAVRWSRTGLSRGVVLGADGRRPRYITEMFPVTDAGTEKIARASYKLGLVVGYAEGRVLSQNQRRIFWRDLVLRLNDPRFHGPIANWTRLQWSQWYVSVAATFSRDHLK